MQPDEYNDKAKGIPYITGASNFSDGTISVSRWTEFPQVITDLGDLLLTCKGTVGEIAHNSIGCAHIARQIMAIRNLYQLNSEYLSLCLEYYLEHIKSSAKGLIPGISREDILNLIIPMPPKHYQTYIVEHIKKIKLIINTISATLN